MSTYKIKQGFIAERNKKEQVIFDGERSILYTLNESAAFIFQQLKQQNDTNKIAASFAKKYDIPQSEASKDVEKLIRRLERLGIVSSE